MKFTQNIIRVGGQSRDENMMEYNLNTIRKKNKALKKSQVSVHNVKKIIQELNVITQTKVDDVFPELIDRAFNDFIKFSFQSPNTFKKKPNENFSKDFEDEIKKELFVIWKNYDFIPNKLFDLIVSKIKDKEIASDLFLTQRKNKNAFIIYQKRSDNKKYDKEDSFDDDDENEIDFENIGTNRIIEGGDYDELAMEVNFRPKENRASSQWNRLLQEIMKGVINLWDLSVDEVDLIKYAAFINKKFDAQGEKLFQEYRIAIGLLERDRLHEDARILEEADIVGLTVSGCARYANLLNLVKCPITVVEEAAEVLESQILSVIAGHTQHLILIGDHKQLRPNLKNYDLTKNKFDVSLFERFIENNIEHVCLSLQRRMRPEIANFIRETIYDASYCDHPDTQKIEDKVLGVKNNVFFFNHNYEEDNIRNEANQSKRNSFEAEMIAAFSEYLIFQNYEATQITILSMYLGQTFSITQQLRNRNLDFIRVKTVDNFQGEENDIIIISLVRSNKISSMGFTTIENRVNVALSRARQALYVFGNYDMLRKCKIWGKIIDLAQNKKFYGDYLQLVCSRHSLVNKVETPHDFKSLSKGGCKSKCNYQYSTCEHTCKLQCHSTSHELEQCQEKCQKKLKCGHPCKGTCGQPCTNKCEVKKFEKRFCGHKIELRCFEIVNEVNCLKGKCQIPLDRCGHPCTRLCGEDCSQSKCKKIVFKQFFCGHSQETACYLNEFRCKRPCEKKLSCGHICKGTCGNCLGGTFHIPCEEECSRKLMCGHKCTTPCYQQCQPCTEKAYHKHYVLYTSCDKPFECGIPCERKCKHYNCTKKCSEPCSYDFCDKPCSELQECHHKCLGLCGEICPKLCKICNPHIKAYDLLNSREDDSFEGRYYELKCGHIFEVKGLDVYMSKQSANKLGHSSISFPACPLCEGPILFFGRYDKRIKDVYSNLLQIKKKKIYEEVNEEELKKIIYLAKKYEQTYNNLEIKGGKFIFKNLNELNLLNKTNQTQFVEVQFTNIRNLFNVLPKILKVMKSLRNIESEQKYRNEDDPEKKRIWNLFVYQVKKIGKSLFLNKCGFKFNYDYWKSLNQKIENLFLFHIAMGSFSKLNEQSAIDRLEKYIFQIFKSNFNFESEQLSELRKYFYDYKILHDLEMKNMQRPMGYEESQWYLCQRGHQYLYDEYEKTGCPYCSDSIIEKDPDCIIEKGPPDCIIEKGPDCIIEKGPDCIIEKGPDCIIEKGPDCIIEKDQLILEESLGN